MARSTAVKRAVLCAGRWRGGTSTRLFEASRPVPQGRRHFGRYQQRHRQALLSRGPKAPSILKKRKNMTEWAYSSGSIWTSDSGTSGMSGSNAILTSHEEVYSVSHQFASPAGGEGDLRSWVMFLLLGSRYVQQLPFYIRLFLAWPRKTQNQAQNSRYVSKNLVK